MRSRIAARARKGKREDGFSVMELLVAMTLAIVVLGAVVTSLVSQLNSQSLSTSRSDSAQEVIPGLERMTRDIRSATSATVNSTGTQITLQTPERNGASTSTSHQVIYTCTVGGNCTRAETGLPTTNVISRVRGPSTNMFTPANASYTSGTVATAPYIGIQLNLAVGTVATSGNVSKTDTTRVVQYNDGATLRNVPTS